jgi:hypothetical protein
MPIAFELAPANSSERQVALAAGIWHSWHLAAIAELFLEQSSGDLALAGSRDSAALNWPLPGVSMRGRPLPLRLVRGRRGRVIGPDHLI